MSRSDAQRFMANSVDLPGNRSSCTVTFDYGEEGLRTLVAVTQAVAFARARALWGNHWLGDPVVTTPRSIYDDITGKTRADWAAHRGLNAHETTAGARRRERKGRY